MSYVRSQLSIYILFKEKLFYRIFAGGLCALDIVLNHPAIFSNMGVFSGSLWWRDKDQDEDDFDESVSRIMHKKVKQNPEFYPWLKFFF